MNISNPRTLRVIELLLNPRLIQDYIKVGADLNIDSVFPFSRREFAAIQWHLYFPHLVVAYKRDSEGFKDLFRDFFQAAVPRLKTMVVVGDYVPAAVELRLIRPYFGFSGLFGNITTKEIPLDELTTAVMEHKIKGLLTIYDMAAAESPPWLDPFGFVKDWRGI